MSTDDQEITTYDVYYNTDGRVEVEARTQEEARMMAEERLRYKLAKHATHIEIDEVRT